MKGKLVTMAVSFLLCVGMVGAGFASWVISSTMTETADGNIQVDTVVDKRLKNYVVDKTGANVYFGAPETVSADAWFTNDTAKTEDLTSSVTLKLDEANLIYLKAKAVNTITLVAEITVTSTDAYAAALASNYIAGPTTTKITKTINLKDATVTKNEDGTETISCDKDYTFDFDFSWGEFFNASVEGKTDPVAVNPYTYFNGLSTDPNNKDHIPSVEGKQWPTLADCAFDVMSAIGEIDTVSLKIEITGTLS